MSAVFPFLKLGCACDPGVESAFRAGLVSGGRTPILVRLACNPGRFERPARPAPSSPYPKKMHSSFTRRRFLGTAASLASLTVAGRAAPAVPSAGPLDSFREPARDLPLDGTADVIVCGAGPAGVAAAITAARAGARVRLFEAHGALVSISAFRVFRVFRG